MSADRLTIEGLRVDTHIGVSDAERAGPQTVVIDIDIEASLEAAGASDDLNDTIDYDALVTSVATAVRASRFALLERLAAEIAEVVSAVVQADGVTVRVKKLHAPVTEEVDGISVYIGRGSLA